MSEVIADRDRGDLTRRVVDPALLYAHGDAGESAAHLGDQFELRRAHDTHSEFDLLLRGHPTPRRLAYSPVPLVIVLAECFFKPRGGPLLAPGVRARFLRAFAEIFDLLRRGL